MHSKSILHEITQVKSAELFMAYVHVVVNFLSQVSFPFLLFLGMLMLYANELKQKKNKIYLR